MNNKKEIALNKAFNFGVIWGMLILWFSIRLLIQTETPDKLCIGAGIFALVLIGFSTFTPYCYLFDNDGITLRYVFFPDERYLWNNIQSIEVKNNSTPPYSIINYFFYANVFSLKGDPQGKRRFYMSGNIRKSLRNKKLLEKYWDGTITGYFFEHRKKHKIKKNPEKQSKPGTCSADEVIIMEREARADVRKWIEPYLQTAKEYSLELHTDYLYITKGLDEQHSRPTENYNYTVIVTITDPTKALNVKVSADLLYVRTGKKSFRGVPNKKAESDLQFYLSDTLKEINKNGIEIYCRAD